ncbi:MAG: hypothetical protein J2P37_33800 [Ktedonobacteraceae bacterium]|nr:hypothetical protein [Ktedonobacteraceae bacterium]
MLLRTGRWLAKNHPDVMSPQQWTSLLAAEYVAAVTHMSVGEFCTAAYCRRMEERVGLPLSANAKEKQLVDLRTFFHEIQGDPYNLPRRFDPARAFRAPNTIKHELTLILGRLDEFAARVKNGLHEADWLTRREIIRALVKRVEIDQEQVRVVFRVNPPILPGLGAIRW